MSAASETVYLRQNVQVLINASQSSISEQPAETCEQFYELSRAANWSLDQTSFDQLLSWLDPDQEMAGNKYEVIRQKLIRFFTSKRCNFAEDLADETFDRVARKLSQIKQYYVGNPLNYIFGVAKKVNLEHIRSVPVRKQPFLHAADEEIEELFKRLEGCIGQLPHKDRELILSYYQGDGRSKIDHRKTLAEELGIPLGALRLRVHRIVSRLRKQVNGTFNGSFL
jgi:DNA-directed RNA polymerase specialized sigma24 family protein